MSDHLPKEVLLEILRRLPVKSLIRLRSISKSQKSLITIPAFIDSHITHSLSLSSNSNKLIVIDRNGRNKVEHYKFVHNDNNDSSFHQFQNVEFSLTSSFELISSNLFVLFQKSNFLNEHHLLFCLFKKCISFENYP